LALIQPTVLLAFTRVHSEVIVTRIEVAVG
jgi:hypothetical protein